MSSFSAANFRYLFRKHWPATGLAETISQIDRDALCLEYKELKRCAPHRKRYFVGHSGNLSGKVRSSRFEEHLAIALWNLNECWPRHDSGWFRMLDYQFPLKAQRSDEDIGKVDLLGVTDQGQLIVIELKVKPKTGKARGDSPMMALIQGLRCAAIIESNIKMIASEAESRTGDRFKDVNIIETSPIIQILAPECWWYAWFELGDRTRNKVGGWEVEFCNLITDIKERLDLTVECLALDMGRTDISYGADGRTPQLRQIPALYPVPWATNSASN